MGFREREKKRLLGLNCGRGRVAAVWGSFRSGGGRGAGDPGGTAWHSRGLVKAGLVWLFCRMICSLCAWRYEYA
jgi:hypothetical protein